MKRVMAAVLVTTWFGVSACAGSSDEPEATGLAESAAVANAGSADAPAETVGNASGDIQCAIVDDGLGFELFFENQLPNSASYSGNVQFFDGDAQVHETTASVVHVAPGEVVREWFFTSRPAEMAISGCIAGGVVATPEPIPTIGLGDVGPCENLREGDFREFVYDLAITNSSETVTAGYAARLAIRNEQGERRVSRIVVTTDEAGAALDLAPGEVWTYTDITLGAPFAESHSCEVISVEKYSDTEFFGTATGVSRGTLSSDVAFASGSAELTEDAKVLLAPGLEAIKTSFEPVCIEGFADSVGSDDANLALSQARADAVAAYLRESGVDGADIEAVGHGERDAGADDVDDPTQRRVDISLAACGS